MMAPGEMVAFLDDSLSKVGEAIEIRRFTGNGNPRPFLSAKVNAAVRVKKAEDLTANQDQSMLEVIVSPTGIGFFPLRKGDVVYRAIGSIHNIEVVKPIVVGTTVVRLDLDVKG